MATLLQQYMNGKQHEFDSIRTNIKMLHILKINQVYYAETQHLLKIVKNSCHVINVDYHFLQSRNMFDENMQLNLDKLKLMATVKRDSKAAKNCEYKTIKHNITIRDPSAADMCDDEDPELDDNEDEEMEERIYSPTFPRNIEATEMVDVEMDKPGLETNDRSPIRPVFVPLAGSTVVKKPILKTRSDIMARPPINARSGPLAVALARNNAIRAATNAVSSTDNSNKGETMDVDVLQPSSSKSTYQINLNAKNSKIRSKEVQLRNILSDTQTNPLFNKGKMCMFDLIIVFQY